MQPHEIRPTTKRQTRKRIGRGPGSGNGTYAGRGLKGQKSRAGGGVRPGFEGGQLPQIKGLPRMRGFTNIFRREYQEVNLGRLSTLPDEVTIVTPELMKQYRLIKNAKLPVKILSQGDFTRPLEIHADRFSQTARQKIESAGGKVEGR